MGAVDWRATSQRLVNTLFVLQCFYTGSQIAVFTLIALVAVRLSGTEQVAGLPSTSLTWGQALAALPVALVMGRFGRRLGLTLAYMAGAIGGLLGIIAILQSIFPLLLVSAVFIGIGRAGSDQTRFAAAELFPEAERARKIGRLVFAGTIGAIGGPLLVVPSGELVNQLGFIADMGPWLIMLILSTSAALIAILFLRPDPLVIARAFSEQNNLPGINALPREPRTLSQLLALPNIQLAIASTLVFQSVMVMLMAMTPLHMSHHQHGRAAISLVISVHTLGMFGLSPLTGALIDRFGRVSMLLLGAALTIAAAIITPLSGDQFPVSAGLFLLGLGWNFGYVSASSMLSVALQDEERTRVQGINETLVFLGAGLGSLVAGPVFANGGYEALSVMGVFMVSLLLALIFRNTALRPKIADANAD